MNLVSPSPPKYTGTPKYFPTNTNFWGWRSRKNQIGKYYGPPWKEKCNRHPILTARMKMGGPPCCSECKDIGAGSLYGHMLTCCYVFLLTCTAPWRMGPMTFLSDRGLRNNRELKLLQSWTPPPQKCNFFPPGRRSPYYINTKILGAHTVQMPTTFIFGQFFPPVFSKCWCHTSPYYVVFTIDFSTFFPCRRRKERRRLEMENFGYKTQNFDSRYSKINQLISTLPQWTANWMINYLIFTFDIQYLYGVIVLILTC
jgi:hypothetical protein